MKLVFVCILAVAVFGGCGPSAQQIQVAKATTYQTSPKNLLDVAIQVAQRDYKIGEVDVATAQFATVPQWYTAEGGRISPNTDGTTDYVQAGGGDVNVSLRVHVLMVDAKTSIIEVTPFTLQLVSGSPQPRELKPDDPNLPGWVGGRVDSLAVAIYEEAKKLFPEGAPR